MEIVLEPDLFDGEEAAAVIKELILVLQVWIMSIKYREREIKSLFWVVWEGTTVYIVL